MDKIKPLSLLSECRSWHIKSCRGHNSVYEEASWLMSNKTWTSAWMHFSIKRLQSIECKEPIYLELTRFHGSVYYYQMWVNFIGKPSPIISGWTKDNWWFCSTSNDKSSGSNNLSLEKIHQEILSVMTTKYSMTFLWYVENDNTKDRSLSKKQPAILPKLWCC